MSENRVKHFLYLNFLSLVDFPPVFLFVCFILESPCACRYSKDDRWYRGKLAGYVDDALSIVKVELVDIGITLEVRSCRVKQLPTEYLSVSCCKL